MADIKKFSRGPVELVNRLNEMIEAINQLQSLNSSTFINVKQCGKSKVLELDFNKLLDRIPKHKGGGMGGEGFLWAVIIDTPTPPNPYAANSSGAYAGQGSYICRLDGAEYAEWESSGAVYTLNSEVVDPFNNRVYIMTNDDSGAPVYPDIAPHANGTDWTISPEIEIKYVEGYSKEGSEVNIKDVVPWYDKGEKVRIVAKTIQTESGDSGAGEEIRYYLMHTLMAVGEPADRTLAIVNGKVQSVWK